MDWIDMEGELLTVRVCIVVALFPFESVMVIVRLWVPASWAEGVQLNCPLALIWLPLIVLPLIESAIAYVGLEKPEVERAKETAVPIDTVVLGDRDCTDTERTVWADAVRGIDVAIPAVAISAMASDAQSRLCFCFFMSMYVLYIKCTIKNDRPFAHSGNGGKVCKTP